MNRRHAGWIPVHFTEEENEEIIQIGSARRGVKEASGMSGEKLEAGHQFGNDGQVMGYAAEYALGKVLGVEADKDVSRTGNGGEHLELPMGELDKHSFQKTLTFNAAWISDPTYDLRFDPSRVPKADVFMLLTGDFDCMYVIGGISAPKFQALCQEKDFGFGLRLVVPQAKLTPARKIMHYLGRDAHVRLLDKEHEARRLQREERFGSLFSTTEQHKDPA